MQNALKLLSNGANYSNLQTEIPVQSMSTCFTSTFAILNTILLIPVVHDRLGCMLLAKQVSHMLRFLTSVAKVVVT